MLLLWVKVLFFPKNTDYFFLPIFFKGVLALNVLKLHMSVWLCTKFQVSSIIITSFRQRNFTNPYPSSHTHTHTHTHPPTHTHTHTHTHTQSAKRIPKMPNLIRVKKIHSVMKNLFWLNVFVTYFTRTLYSLHYQSTKVFLAFKK